MTRTQVTNPDGSITYKQSWNDTTINKSNTPVKKVTKPIVKPVKKVTKPIVKPVKKVTTNVPSKSISSKIVTPNSREITSLPPMQSKLEVKPEITAPLGIPNNTFTPTTQKEKVVKWKIDDYNLNKRSGETFDVYRKRIQDRANQNAEKAKSHEGSKGVFQKDDKSNDKVCRTC
jgi:hypothetical protein